MKRSITVLVRDIAEVRVSEDDTGNWHAETRPDIMEETDWTPATITSVSKPIPPDAPISATYYDPIHGGMLYAKCKTSFESAMVSLLNRIADALDTANDKRSP